MKPVDQDPHTRSTQPPAFALRPAGGPPGPALECVVLEEPVREKPSCRSQSVGYDRSSVLDLEKPTSHGRPAVSHDVRALIRKMSTANPLWGAPRFTAIAEIGDLGKSVDRRQIHASPSTSPVPNVAQFLTNHASQIMAADLFVVPTVTFRLLFVLVILAHDRRRMSTWRSPSIRQRPGRHSSFAMPSQRTKRPVSPPRSRFGLCARRDHHRRDEHAGGSNRAAIAVAERIRGARHRLDPTRVPRSRHRGQRSGASSGAHRVRRLLHALANTSRARQGHAESAPGHTAVSRSDCRHSRSRRPTSPLRPRRGITAVGASQHRHSRSTAL